MKLKYPIENVHTLSVDEVLTTLETNIEKGITQTEADIRLQQYGANIYASQKAKPLWFMLLLQFKSPIVYLLIFAVAVSLYFQNYIEAIAIAVVIVVNALIGFFMELQARSSMKALKEMDVIMCNVIRDGKAQQIPSEKITIGDLLVLDAGDVIAGDARLVEANQVQCDESSLTGESLPTEKNTEKLPIATALSDQLNMVFKGSAVMNGNGKAVVTSIAMQTQLGTITALVDTHKETKTPLDKKIAALSIKLIWITLVMTSIFAVTGIIQGKNWELILETSIALAVAAFPEGLPIVATVALAYGMLLMVKRNAIVKKLSAVETLGSTNVILTDKTGTLTENKIFVDAFSFPQENIKVSIENNTLKYGEGSKEKSKINIDKLMLIAALCNNATIKKIEDKDTLVGDPIEMALVQLINATGTTSDTIKKENERIAEMPFSAETKIMGTLHKNSKSNFVAAKGSVEHLLKNCTQLIIDETIKELTEEERKKILETSESMAANGIRVLAFAYKEDSNINAEDFLNNLIYVAMVGFIDPPRLDIKEAIINCRKAGIKIVMITGDHPLTALNIAKKVGLVDDGEQNYVVGTELPNMDALTNEWEKKILATAIFARTTPKQKLEIVGIFQNAGNIVAMTGDGVNDAPALKKADIGIAMGLRGTQVAKETASIVLKDDSFTSIAAAVSHGREIYQNIQKFVMYLVSCNISEIFIVTALGFVVPAATLLPLQILFLNMVTDVFPALALGLGKGDNTIMDRPPRDPKNVIVSNKEWGVIGTYALIITASVVAAVLYCKLYLVVDDTIANNVAFVTLAFAQLFHVFNMSSAESKLFANEITRNKFIWFAFIICTTLMIVVFAIPQVRLVLGLSNISIDIWLVAVVASLVPLLLVQLYKLISKRK